MSVIQTTKHPATGAEESFAKGVIKRIIIKRLNADGSAKTTQFKCKKTGQTKAINSTHSAFIILESGGEEAFINFGTMEIKNLQYENKFQIKEGEKYTDLLPGMEISVYPISTRQYKKKVKDASGNVTGEEDAISYEGKRGNVTILDRSNAVQGNAFQGPSAASGGSQAQSGATVKVYGEIVNLVGSVAQVKGDKGEWTVTLSDEQVSQVSKGGRLAGQLAADGTISQFKAYGPAGQRSQSSGSSGGFKKDDLPVRLGNALTITDAMFPNAAIIDQKVIIEQVLAAMDGVKAKLRSEFKSMDDYSFGARLGQCGILAARHSQEGIDQFLENVEATFRFVCSMEESLRAGAAAPEPAKQPQQQVPAQQPQQQSQAPVQQQSAPAAVDPQDYHQPPMDFDDDIPFAPVGLQYARHAIHAL